MSGSAATIPLDVAGGGGPSSPQLPGASLGQLSQFTDLANKINQQKMFNATFGARTRAGQIISGAPDLESGLAQAAQDPNVAAFGGEVLGQYRQMQQTMTQTAGMQQEQNAHGLQAVMKAASMAAADPAHAQEFFKMGAQTLPPEVAKRDMPAMQTLWGTLTDGLTGNPQTDGAMIRQRAVAMFGGAGGTPESLAAMLGQRPVEADLGGRKVFGSQSLLTGGMAPATSMGVSLAPQIANVPTEEGGTRAAVFGGGGGAGPSNGLSTATPGTSGAPNPLLGGIPNPPEGPGTTLGQSPGKAQISYQEGIGKDMADYRKNLNDNVTAGNNIMQSIAQAREAMQQFKPGGGAGTYAQVAQIAQSLGVSQSIVDKIANGNLAATQEMQKQMVGTALGQVKQQMDGQGRITQAEFEQFRRNNPNIETDPRAIEKIFNFWTQTHNRNVEEQAGLANYTGPIEKWPSIWQQQLGQKGYVVPVQTQGGAALSATQPEGQTQAAGAKPGSYSKQEDVVSAYKSGKLSRDDAKKLLQSNGWAQ